MYDDISILKRKYLNKEKAVKYKRIQIPIGHEDIRMFQELADGHRKPFYWTFDEIDVEFIKDDEEEWWNIKKKQ